METHRQERANIILRRKICDRLDEWKAKKGHMSLLIRGQRQVGKTFAVREFAKTYENSIEVDLSTDARMRSAFEGSFCVDDVIQALTIEDTSFDPVPGKTLIFLDEIQSCPQARAFLKLFTEDGRFDVIAAGSFLGLYEGDSNGSTSPLIPVGYEEHMRMYALDFEEFLWAKGFRDDIVETVRDSIRSREPLMPHILGAMDGVFTEFMMVGGMPAAVSRYVSGEGMRSVTESQDAIIAGGYDDMFRYSGRTDATKIRKCYDSIPFQLSESNKKFMYSRIERKESRTGARTYGDALAWIEGAGMGNMCCSLRKVTRPSAMSRRPDQFKVYLSDTGLLIRMMDRGGDNILAAVRRGDREFNQGAIMENVVAECLMKAGLQCNYYIHRKDPGRMELDFVVDLGREVAVIEVKSGRSRDAPSLSKTLGDDRFQRRMKFEKANISVDVDGIEHYPLFAAAFIRDMQTDDGFLDSIVCKPVPEWL